MNNEYDANRELAKSRTYTYHEPVTSTKGNTGLGGWIYYIYCFIATALILWEAW